MLDLIRTYPLGFALLVAVAGLVVFGKGMTPGGRF
jgi:hypothetical protein